MLEGHWGAFITEGRREGRREGGKKRGLASGKEREKGKVPSMLCVRHGRRKNRASGRGRNTGGKRHRR